MLELERFFELALEDFCFGAGFAAGTAVVNVGAVAAASGDVSAAADGRSAVKTVGICLALEYRPVSATAKAAVTALMTTAEMMTVRTTRFMCRPSRIAVFGSADIVP